MFKNNLMNQFILCGIHQTNVRSFNFNDPCFKLLSFLELKSLPTLKTLRPFMNEFQPFMGDLNLQKIDNECQKLRTLIVTGEIKVEEGEKLSNFGVGCWK